MTVDHRPTAPRPPKGERRRVEEDCAWARLFLEIDQPAIAAELVKQLDKTTNADIRRDNFPLYVLAQQTLAKYKVAKEREQRAANFVRQVVFYTAVLPVVKLWGGLVWLFEVGVEAMPPANTSPAVFRIRQLQNDPEIAPAIRSHSQPEKSRGVNAA